MLCEPQDLTPEEALLFRRVARLASLKLSESNLALMLVAVANSNDAPAICEFCDLPATVTNAGEDCLDLCAGHATPEPGPRFAYSLDGEGYDGDYGSREDALSEAIDAARERDESAGEGPWGRVHTGLRVDPPIRKWVDDHADRFLDALRDAAYDEAGECAGRWLQKVTPPHERRLGELLADALERWMRETGNEPAFFTVEKTQEHEVPEGEEASDA